MDVGRDWMIKPRKSCVFFLCLLFIILCARVINFTTFWERRWGSQSLISGIKVRRWIYCEYTRWRRWCQVDNDDRWRHHNEEEEEKV